MARLTKEQPAAPHSSPVSSTKSRSSSFVQYLHTKRVILSILSILITIGMVIGLLFVAHHYYHMWGGQGFLKSRTIEEALDTLFFPMRDSPGKADAESKLCLPMRKVTEFDNIFLEHDPELRRAVSAGSPPNNTIPFYVCGDQAQDCEAYSQPNICCPVGFVCHSTTKKITSSGIYCCAYNASSADCKATASDKPQCLPGSFECPSFTGGGCCPAGSECLNQTTTTTTVTSTYPFSTQTKTIGGGCALYLGNSGGQLLTTTTTTSTSPTTSTTWSQDYSTTIEHSTTSSVSTINPDTPTTTGGPAGGSTTATFLGTPTGTRVREGEVAQIGAGTGLTDTWGFRTFVSSRSPGATALWLVIVAVGFACL